MPHIPGAKFPYERQPPEGFEPGTFGCHEALYLASTFMMMVEQHVERHAGGHGPTACIDLC